MPSLPRLPSRGQDSWVVQTLALLLWIHPTDLDPTDTSQQGTGNLLTSLQPFIHELSLGNILGIADHQEVGDPFQGDLLVPVDPLFSTGVSTGHGRGIPFLGCQHLGSLKRLCSATGDWRETKSAIRKDIRLCPFACLYPCSCLHPGFLPLSGNYPAVP